MLDVLQALLMLYHRPMSKNQQPATDPREYDARRGEWIALEYSRGDCTLKELHEEHRSLIPEPFFVNRWRKDYPAFDLLMRDAEITRAQDMADSLLAVVDDDEQSPGSRRVRTQARTWLASRLDRERYGSAEKGARVEVGTVNNVRVIAATMSDDQLAAIISAGQGGHPPPPGEAPPVEQAGSNPSSLTNTSLRPPLTSDFHRVSNPEAKTHLTSESSEQQTQPTPVDTE